MKTISDNSHLIGSSTARHIVWQQDEKKVRHLTIDGKPSGTIRKARQGWITEQPDGTRHMFHRSLAGLRAACDSLISGDFG